jgi:phage tail sheath protein FI
MPEYLSPGVYVEEVPSAVKPIAGVSTSTAAFVGVVPDQLTIVEENPSYDPTQPTTKEDGADGTMAKSPNPPYVTWTFPYEKAKWQAAKSKLDGLTEHNSRPPRPKKGADPREYRKAQEDFSQADARMSAGEIAKKGQPILCTSFTDFKKSFGDFSTNGLPADSLPAGAPAPEGFQNQLAHAVFGFFNNGGTRCWVMRQPTLKDLQDPDALAPFEAIDEISLVAAPGVVDPAGIVQSNIIDHCETLADRFAILDSPRNPADFTEDAIKVPPRNTNFGALYFPWIKVFDIVTARLQPDSDGEIFVPPSGHMAGIYSRVDHERGVHKAPANEVVRGAMGVEPHLSKAQQDGLNPYGICCIRFINEGILVWGARTIGGDANADLKYINVRRTLLFIEKSIDHGTQWVVFEPNDRSLWAKIVLNVSAFLTTVWRDGALFGSTPQEAFYVKCDDETNPPENRDLGQVTTEIGVAIVRPAEFVVFRISQWAGPRGQQ